jgi:hypothetical protein
MKCQSGLRWRQPKMTIEVNGLVHEVPNGLKTARYGCRVLVADRGQFIR